MRILARLLLCLAILPGLPALAQSAPSQDGDVAALRKEVQELRQQLEQQQREHDAQMSELRQRMSAQTPATMPATSQPAAGAAAPAQGASQPAATASSPADELQAAIRQAQSPTAPAATSQPGAAEGNWLSTDWLSFSQPPAPVQSFNPDISLVGDFQGRHDSDVGGFLSDNRIVRELELGISGNIDPYARVVSIFSVHPKPDPDSGYDIDVEEAYVESLSSIDGFGGKVGKFRLDFGKINELHQHALPWPEYPLVIQSFFGEEGVAAEGASVSWLAPTDQFIELTSQSVAKSKDSLLAGDDSDSFVQLLHLKTFNDLSTNSTLEWGLSGAVMPTSDTPGTASDAVEGMDLTYKWRPTKEGLYQSFKWINELLTSQRQVDGRHVCAWGGYSAPEYQFARQWAAGLRYDYTQDPTDSSRNTQAIGAYLTFAQSEFLYWRLGYQFSHRNFLVHNSEDDHTIFLQLDFSLGPHPAHKY